MARAITSDFRDELLASTNCPIFLYEGVFVGFTLRLWNGLGNLTWDGNTWLGNGWFRDFSSIEESDDISVTGMEITLAGVPQDLISTVLSSVKQNASGKLWLGFLNSSGAVIADPYLTFEGKLDVPIIDDQPDGPIIQISYESHLVDLDRTKEYRYTTESQKLFDAADKGFEFVEKIAATWKGQWGATKKQIDKKTARKATTRGGSKRR